MKSLLLLWLPLAMISGAEIESPVRLATTQVDSIGSVPLHVHHTLVVEDAEETRDSKESWDSDELLASASTRSDVALERGKALRATRVARGPSRARGVVFARGPPA